MKKLAFLGAALLAAAVTASTALAVHSPPAANPQQCTQGTLVVNVNYTLKNDYDSGVAGNAWANDTINRHLQIRQVGRSAPTSATQYCAMVDDTGAFVTFAGISPAGTGHVSAGINGRIMGGYDTTLFTGTLNPSPAYVTHGNLGTFDLQCTDAYNCPGAHPSFLSYFNGSPAWDYADWSWAYHTAKNGDWLNADTGNTGDITG
jgi:hypothetical protein